MKWIALALTGYCLLLSFLAERQVSAVDRRFQINLAQKEFDLVWMSKRIILKPSAAGVPILSAVGLALVIE